MKKRIVFILILLFAGGVIYYATSPLLPEKKDNIILYGNIDIRDVALGFRVSGRIDTLFFEEGDRVEKGTLLAQLDKEPFSLELALRQAEVSEAKATFANAQKLFLRYRSLVNSRAVSQSTYDDALAAKDEAAAKVATAEANVSLAKVRLADTDIRAPRSGILLTRVTEPGAIVATGAPVYVLALDNPVWVRAYIDETNLHNVYPGKKAIVTHDGGGQYTGQVGFISPQAEFTPKSVETTQLRTDLVYRLRIIIDAPDNGLRQGMPVTVTFSD